MLLLGILVQLSADMLKMEILNTSLLYKTYILKSSYTSPFLLLI